MLVFVGCSKRLRQFTKRRSAAKAEENVEVEGGVHAVQKERIAGGYTLFGWPVSCL